MSVDWLSASHQLDLVGSGEASLSELRDGGIRRCETLNPDVGFMVCPLYERAPGGVPMLLKDAGEEIAGTPHWAGLAALRDAEHRSSRTTALAERFETSGFSIIGKSACPPLANSVATEPPGFPPTRNPWDLSRSAGGSSGGAAAAVACGAVPIAHGSDATGSLRFPAVLCGLVTLVPTAGTIESVAPCGRPRDQIWRDFVLARDAQDLSLLFAILAGTHEPNISAPIQRVRLLDHDPELGLPVDPACARAVHAVGALLEQFDHDVDIGWPDALDSLWQRVGDAFAITADATRPAILRWIEQQLGRPIQDGDVPADVVEAAARDEGRAAGDRQRARSVIDSAMTPLLGWWDQHDLLVTTATFMAGWQLGGQPGYPECGTLAAPFSLTGQPSVVVPVLDDANATPVGVQIVGRRGSDEKLLRLANELQLQLDWLSFTPPTFAT
jgi:amidase